MSRLKISEQLSLPESASTWVLSYLAKRGAGKTYCASVQAEEMIKNQTPIVVIDGMGIWWGLRLSKDTKSDGLPVVVFGGEHADLPLIVDKAKDMAKAVVESNISCVLDLSIFSKGQSRKVLTEFLDELYKLNRVERHVFIEEADMYAPQRTIGPEQAVCLGAVDNFVRRGGNHNLGCTLITQRSAVLNKDVLTQSDCLIVMRTLAPQDKKAIQAWVEEQTDEDKSALNQWYDSLKELENGEAWVWHPENPKIFEKIKFRERETFHATREFIRQPQSASVRLMDVSEFVSKFKKVFEPKPKEQPHPIPTPPPKPITLHSPRPQTAIPIPKQVYETRHQTHVRPERIQTALDFEPITIRQSVPNIEIQKLKPTLSIPVELLDQPTTPLGRVCVVLKNHTGRPDQWSNKGIKREVLNHAWEDTGVDEAIDQLIRWEILSRKSNSMLYFYANRVTIIDQNVNLEIQ